MADIEFGDLRDGGDGRDIVEGQAMAGMRFDAVLGRQRGRIGDAAQFRRARAAVQMRIGPGVKFDHGRAKLDRGVDLRGVGLDEQADADARVAQLRDDGPQRLQLPCCVQPALGRALLALFRHDAGGMRPVAQRDVQHFLRRRHFQIERHVQRRHQHGDILVANMAAILAQMRGDAVRARLHGQQRRLDRIGMGAAARVADGRHMVDIDPQAQRRGHRPIASGCRA